jgi:Fur family peroxide stress response transcriptional regulator
MSRVGRKHSVKRDAILRTIRSTASHPGAQWVYDRLKPSIPGLSLGTVYRNIKMFREEGSIISVGVVDGEERFDGRVNPHPHLVCCCCGSVADLPCPADLPPFEMERGPGTYPGTSSPGFVIDYRRTVYYGFCGECAQETPKAAL